MPLGQSILAGLVLLVIGDSHMASPNYLIGPLHDALVSAGATVHSYGFCGAQAENWVLGATVSCGRAERHGTSPAVADRAAEARTWPLGELIERHHPNLIVVELGDTMAAYGQETLPQAWIYGQVRTLTNLIKKDDLPCVWVGPAWGSDGFAYHKTVRRVKEMSDFLTRTVAPCRYVDSTLFSRPGEWPTTDGQHLTPAGYRAWGEDIAGAIVQLAPQLSAKP
jgi:hypothetical protein